MEEYKTKYIRSLEERLAAAAALRAEEGKAAALRIEAVTLAATARQLRTQLERSLREAGSGSGVPPPPQLSVHTEAVLLATFESDSEHAFDPQPEDEPITANTANSSSKNANPTTTALPTPWLVILRKLYPGQISHLRPHHRQLIDHAVHEEFLVPRMGRDAAQTMLGTTSTATAYYAIPPDLLEEFDDWFTLKMDELISSDDFSMKTSRRKSAPVSASSSTGPSPPTKISSSHQQNQNNHQNVSSSSSANTQSRRVTISHLDSEFQRKPSPLSSMQFSSSAASRDRTSSSASSSKPKHQFPTKDGSIIYSVAPRATLPDGSPNIEGYRPWTDVIRSKYPTFNKAGSHMCRTAGSFLELKKIKKISMAAQTSARSSKPAFCLPEEYHKEFLEFMDATFFHDGQFGREESHLAGYNYASKGKDSSSSEEDEKGNAEDDEYEDGMQVDEDEDELSPPRASTSSTSARRDRNDVENRDTRSQNKQSQSMEPTPEPLGSLSTGNQPVNEHDWKECLLDTQREYLKQQSRNTKLLLHMRQLVNSFLRSLHRRKSPNYGEAEGDEDFGDEESTTSVVPSESITEFQEWFERGIQENFGLPIEAMDVNISTGSRSSRSPRRRASASPQRRSMTASPARKQEQLARRSPFEVSDSVAKRVKINDSGTTESTGSAINPSDDGTNGRRSSMTEGSMASSSSSKYITKSGYKLTKYNSIFVKLMPEFKSLSRDARVAIKKGVKMFLQQEMGDKFSECVFTVDGADHHTYGVPEHLLAEFTQWGRTELKRCFPDKAVA
ncbi:hypothetical protein HDU79_006113 [Rhizoclosmatium sp. JEL0117]|nr:hypothetical protein HDU79_006113 [Rhizoclosmatium sp. JEL0117]